MSKEETLEQRIRREALEYRSRWSDCNGDVEESDIAGVRPLVERIVELEQAPAKVDAAQGETLIKRVGREVGPALDRYQACEGGNHSSMAAAIGPLVAANMGLESDLKTARDSGQAYADRIPELEKAYWRAATNGNREISRLNGVIANLREVIAQASAAQTAGRDQASEIERLRDERDSARAAMATEHIAQREEIQRLRVALDDAQAVIDRADDVRRKLREDADAAVKRADDADDEIERLTTTIDVLAGRLAARGQS